MSELHRATPEPTPLPGRKASIRPTETFHGKRGSLFLYMVEPGVIYAQSIGHLDVEGAEAFKSFAEGAFSRAPSTSIFHDWAEMTSYDSDARAGLTRWTIDQRRHIGRVVFLVRSKLVSMGVATANLATSPLGVSLHSHTARADFEREFAKTTSSSNDHTAR